LKVANRLVSLLFVHLRLVSKPSHVLLQLRIFFLELIGCLHKLTRVGVRLIIFLLQAPEALL
jgi:hypothetical protein